MTKKKSLLFSVLSTLLTSFVFGLTSFNSIVMFKAEFQFFQEPFLKELDFRVRVMGKKLIKERK